MGSHRTLIQFEAERTLLSSPDQGEVAIPIGTEHLANDVLGVT